MQKNLKKIKKKRWKRLNLWRILGTNLLLLVNFWDQIFMTVFPEDFFLFSTLNSKTSKNKRKCVTKCVTAKIYPMKVRILQIIFSKWLYVQFKPFFHKSETALPKQFFLIFFFYFLFFFILNSRMFKNMCIWCHKLCNSKMGVGPTFTWSNEPWSICCRLSFKVSAHFIKVRTLGQPKQIDSKVTKIGQLN